MLANKNIRSILSQLFVTIQSHKKHVILCVSKENIQFLNILIKCGILYSYLLIKPNYYKLILKRCNFTFKFLKNQKKISNKKISNLNIKEPNMFIFILIQIEGKRKLINVNKKNCIFTNFNSSGGVLFLKVF